MTRDELGRLVRETWVRYCIETGDTKPSHIAPYDELSEWDKEADRRIGEAVVQAYLADDEIDFAYEPIHGGAFTGHIRNTVVMDQPVELESDGCEHIFETAVTTGGVRCHKCGVIFPVYKPSFR
jgi:hypothetical protein